MLCGYGFHRNKIVFLGHYYGSCKQEQNPNIKTIFKLQDRCIPVVAAVESRGARHICNSYIVWFSELWYSCPKTRIYWWLYTYENTWERCSIWLFRCTIFSLCLCNDLATFSASPANKRLENQLPRSRTQRIRANKKIFIPKINHYEPTLILLHHTGHPPT